MFEKSIKHIYFEDSKTKEITIRLNPEWEKEQIQKRFEIFLKQSNIPNDYWDLNFDIYQGEKSRSSVNKCLYYARECKNKKFHNISLYLYGQNSSQKTMIACAIGKEFIRQGLIVKFILAGELINSLMKLQGFNVDNEINLRIKKLKYETDLVIIDDAFDPNKALMWKSENKGMIIQEWDMFFRHLISHDIKIIITSNYPLNKIRSDYGKSLFELIDRNFEQLNFEDNIKEKRKERLKSVFDLN